MSSTEQNVPSREKDDFGLGVAQIVITAATPMEDIDHPFPGADEVANDTAKSTENSEVDVTPNVTNEISESDNKEVTIITDEQDEPEVTEITEETEEKSVVDDLPADSAPFPVSSSSGSEADSTSGPSTADNSQSLPSRGTVIEVEITDEPEIVQEKIVAGRASIPDELQPDQLEKLQNLKESNA